MSVTAPSGLRDVMGAFLHNSGCTFRVWAPFAGALSVKLWQSNTTHLIPMVQDSAQGYGPHCWSVFVPGVSAGDHYRYVITSGGAPFERVDPVARSIVYPHWSESSQDDSDARSVVTERTFSWGPTFQAPGWRELVIYQLHVGTFVHKASGGSVGVDDLIAQLSYIKELGVTAIQLLPFTEFASRLSLGYNSVLPYAIERDYGSPEDVKRFVQAAHNLGMSVIVDVVFNHINTDQGGRLLPYSLFAYDGWTSQHNPCGIYFYGGDELNTPWAAPRPDYGRTEVRRYLLENALMWLEEYQVDGLRFDSTKCIRRRQGPCGEWCCGSDIGDGARNYGWELMQEINAAIRARQPWKITIAEDLDDNNPAITSQSPGGAGFGAQWDSRLRGAVRDAVTRPEHEINLDAIAWELGHPPGEEAFKRVLYAESHDEAQAKRLPDLIAPGDAEGRVARKKTMLVTGVLFTAPGIPMLFQGHEFLDWRVWSDGLPLDWTRAGRFSCYRQFYKDLIRARTNADGHTRGLCGTGTRVLQANPTTKVLAYHRWDQAGGDVVVVANFSGRVYPVYRLGFPRPGVWSVRLNSDANVYSDQNDFNATPVFEVQTQDVSWDGMQYSGEVSIGPYSIVLYSPR